MEQVIVSRTHQPLDTQEESPYMPGWGPEDYAPPEMKLVQSSSRSHTEEGVEMGRFHCAQTGEVKESLRMVILRAQRTRVLWPDTLGPPECASDDRNSPRPGCKYSGPCSNCPVGNDAPWLLSEEDKRDYCLPAYTLLVLDRESGQPYLMRVNGTSVQGFKGLWTTFRLAYQGRPFSAETELTTQKRSNDRGTFYVMRPRILQSLGAEEAAHYQEMAQAMMGVKLTAQEEPEEPKAVEPTPPQEYQGRLVEGPSLQYTPEGEYTAAITLDAGKSLLIDARAYGEVAERLHGQVISHPMLKILVQERDSDSEDECRFRLLSYELLEDMFASMEDRRAVAEAAQKAGLTIQEARERLQRLFPGAKGTVDLTQTQANKLILCLRGEEAWPWEAERQPSRGQPRQEDIPF